MTGSFPDWSSVLGAASHARANNVVLTHGAARAIVAHRALVTSALTRPDTQQANPRAVVVFLLIGECPATVDELFTALYTGAEYAALSAGDKRVADMFRAYLTARVTGNGLMDAQPLIGWGDNMALVR